MAGYLRDVRTLAKIGGVLACCSILSPVPSPAWAADTSNVTHVLAGTWQSSDFQDETNPGCSIGASGSANVGRIVIGASQRRPAPMNMVIRKSGWSIPAGTAIQARAVFSNGLTMDLSGRGSGEAAQFDLDTGQVPTFMHGLTASTDMQILFAGSEAPWRFDLAGTSKVVNAMGDCFVAHHIEGVAPPFSKAPASVVPPGATSAATQPFGGTLPNASEPEAARPAPLSSSTTPGHTPPDLPAQTSPDDGRSSATVAATGSAGGTCKENWHRCTDNADLVNNYNKYDEVKYHCKDEADKQAKYGTPVWPGFWSGGAFGSFKRGADYVSTGVVTAVEPDVQFQNGFGAMVHSTVICRYDLNAKSVLSVNVVQHE